MTPSSSQPAEAVTVLTDRGRSDDAAVRSDGRAPYMPALTSLRFFAAFHVVLYHAYPWHDPSVCGEPGMLHALWQRFCGHGFIAVGFFFTLSGFILACNYPRERLTDTRAFYRARFARVYPVYALGLVLALPFLLVHTVRDRSYGHALIECGLAFSLLQAWFPRYWNAVNIPGWSLSVEAFFYAVYPWLVRPLLRFSRSGRRAAFALLALYALALLGPTLGTFLSQSGMPLSDVSVSANLLRYFPPFALPEFAAGMVLGEVHRRGFLPDHTRRLLWPALLLLILVLGSDVIPYMLLHNGALLPLFGVIILACSRDGATPRVLSRPFLRELGEASYSLYVLHLLLFIYVKIVIERSGLDPSAPWVFPVYAAFALFVSMVSYRGLEQPARRWLNARWASSPLRG